MMRCVKRWLSSLLGHRTTSRLLIEERERIVSADGERKLFETEQEEGDGAEEERVTPELVPIIFLQLGRGHSDG